MSGPGYTGPHSESQRLRQEAVLKDKRIASLEADLEVMSRHRNDFHERAERAEAALAERDIGFRILQAQKENHKQARAELADDLDWLIDTLDFNLQESGFAQKALDKRHADLRARAEEGAG